MKYFTPIILIAVCSISCSPDKNSSETVVSNYRTDSLSSAVIDSNNSGNSSIAKISGQVFCKGYSENILLDESEKIRFFKNTPCQLRVERIELNNGTVFQHSPIVSLIKYDIKYDELLDSRSNIIDAFEQNAQDSIIVLDKKSKKLKLQKVSECKYSKNNNFKSWNCKGSNDEAYFSLKVVNGSLAIEIQKIDKKPKELDIVHSETIDIQTYFTNENIEDKDPPKILKAFINNQYDYFFQTSNKNNFNPIFYLLCPFNSLNYSEDIMSTMDEKNIVETFSNGCISIDDGFNLSKYLRSNTEYVILSTVNMNTEYININNKYIYRRKYEFPFVKYLLNKEIKN